VLLIAIAAVLAAPGWAERERNADEEYAVYSAYLSEGLLNDAHNWSVGGPVQVVVQDITTVGGNLRLRALYLLRYVLMEKINGSWRVLDESSTWNS